MLRGPPREDQLPSPGVDLLEQAVEEHAVPRAARGRQVVQDPVVDGDQRVSLLRELALVLVGQPPARRPHGRNGVTLVCTPYRTRGSGSRRRGAGAAPLRMSGGPHRRWPGPGFPGRRGTADLRRQG